METGKTRVDGRPDVILDLERLKRNCHGNLEIVTELLNHLLSKSAPKWMTSLEEGIEAGDPQQLQGVCHAMKGAAATVFAWRISNIALDFEGLARQGEIGTLRGRMVELRHAFTELEQWRAGRL